MGSSRIDLLAIDPVILADNEDWLAAMPKT